MATRTDAILTPKFRVRWVQLAQPDDKGKYGLVMLWAKGTDLTKLKNLVREAIKGEWGDKYKPAQLSPPFKDGNLKTDDEGEVYPEYVDTTWAGCNTKFLPTVLDGTKGKKPIPTAELASAVYDGCYCVAQVSAYAWEHKNEKTKKVIKRGVSFQLENLLKYADGEPIAGGGKKYNADAAFAEVEVDSEDASNYDDDDDL